MPVRLLPPVAARQWLRFSEERRQFRPRSDQRVRRRPACHSDRMPARPTPRYAQQERCRLQRYAQRSEASRRPVRWRPGLASHATRRSNDVPNGATRGSRRPAFDVGKWSPSARMNAVAAVSVAGLSRGRSGNSACLQQAAKCSRRDMTKIAGSGIHSVLHCIALSFAPPFGGQQRHARNCAFHESTETTYSAHALRSRHCGSCKT